MNDYRIGTTSRYADRVGANHFKHTVRLPRSATVDAEQTYRLVVLELLEVPGLSLQQEVLFGFVGVGRKLVVRGIGHPLCVTFGNHVDGTTALVSTWVDDHASRWPRWLRSERPGVERFGKLLVQALKRHELEFSERYGMSHDRIDQPGDGSAPG